MIKLHLGCGPHIFPGWRNYDLAPGEGGIAHDLRRPLMLVAGTADFVFSEHFLEHLPRADGVRFLRECHRLLKPGGVLRLTMPNLEQLAADYIARRVINLPGVWEPMTPAAMLNEGMRLWGHEFLYDADEAWLALREAGFQENMIRAQQWHLSTHEELCRLEVRPFLNDLILEATK